MMADFPRFYGGDGEDAEVFIERMEFSCLLANKEDSRSMLKILQFCLQGDARKWFKEYEACMQVSNPSCVMRYVAIKEDFLERFKKVENQQEVWHAIERLVQGDDQSVDAFVKEFNAMWNRWCVALGSESPPSSLKKCMFMQGLRADLRLKVELKRHKSFDDAVMVAKHKEWKLERKRELGLQQYVKPKVSPCIDVSTKIPFFYHASCLEKHKEACDKDEIVYKRSHVMPSMLFMPFGGSTHNKDYDVLGDMNVKEDLNAEKEDAFVLFEGVYEEVSQVQDDLDCLPKSDDASEILVDYVDGAPTNGELLEDHCDVMAENTFCDQVERQVLKDMCSHENLSVMSTLKLVDVDSHVEVAKACIEKSMVMAETCGLESEKHDVDVHEHMKKIVLEIDADAKKSYSAPLHDLPMKEALCVGLWEASLCLKEAWLPFMAYAWILHTSRGLIIIYESLIYALWPFDPGGRDALCYC